MWRTARAAATAGVAGSCAPVSGPSAAVLGDVGVSPGAVDSSYATADESKGIVELRAVNESELSKYVSTAGAAATAGESGGNTGLLEVIESDFPSLPNSSHSLNSCLRSSRSACARDARAVVSARVCPVASSSAEFAAVAHAHASILHGARNPGGTGGLLPVQRSTSYCLDNSWSDTFRVQGPTGTRRVKGGVSGPAEDLRPVSEVAARVNFRPAASVREQVAGSLPRRQPGAGTRQVREGAVTPSLHLEVPGIQFVST